MLPKCKMYLSGYVIMNNFIGTGSQESERVSFRSKSEGFGAEMNCGVRSKVDPVLSGSVGFGRLPPTQPSIYQRVQSWWFKRMGFLDLVW